MKNVIVGLAAIIAIGLCNCPASADRSADVSQAQIDGIVDGIATDLWTQTDFYWHKGDYPRIVGLDRIIIQAEPHFVEPYVTGGWLLESTATSDLSQAKADCKNGLDSALAASRVDPSNHAAALHALGVAVGKLQAARDDIKQADDLMKQAEALYQAGAANNPTDSYANYCLGTFYYGTVHDYKAADGAYLNDVTRCPAADVNDWKMYAHTLERENRINEAVTMWQQIHSRWPNGPAVVVNLNRALARQASAHADRDQPTNGSLSP